MNALLSYDFASLYRGILRPFTNDAFGPELATILLLLALLVLILFLAATAPKALRLRSALAAIRGRPASVEESNKRTLFQNSYEIIDNTLLSNKAIRDAWHEFSKTLILPTSNNQPTILATTRPHNFFNPRTLCTQYEFVASLPNFFVGFGLLGTFIGLIAALTFSTESLTQAVDQDQIKKALNLLLTTAAAKFYISAAGLVASLILSLFIKLTIRHFNRTIYKINTALEERLLFATEQSITEQQLLVQKNSLEELRLFNSNIAMKVGDAVRTAIQGSNDAVTNKLSDIAESFAKLASETGTGAGKALNEAMKDALDSSLSQASDSIRAVALSLQELPTQLSAAATEIRNTGSASINEHLRLTESVQQGVDQLLRNAGAQISGGIERATEGLVGNLRETGSAFGASAEKLSAFFEQFTAKGDEYVNSLTSISSQSAVLEDRLSNLCSDIATATGALSRANTTVGDNLSHLTQAIAEFGRVGTETSQSIRTSQESIKGTVDTLLRQMSLHIGRFDNVDEQLAGVFNKIGSHLELQSSQMSNQLSRMDQALARAVNHFEQLIEDHLADAMPRAIAAE
jgi:hypothetical protein